MIVMSVLFVAGLSLVTVQSAQACTIDVHCYATAGNYPAGTDGVYSQVQPLCLAVPYVNFVTDEVWLTGINGYWVETGFIDNNSNISGLGNFPNQQQAFWGDFRPVDNAFHGHVFATNSALVNSTAWIRKTATNTYMVIFGPSNNYVGYSTLNSMIGSGWSVGSETTSNATASMAYYRTMQYYASGAWHAPSLPISVSSDPPQTQVWVSLYDAMNAGAPC
jgi:hypothetical protein